MSLEKDLKETLTRYGERVRPRTDAFDGVERKVRRAHRRRLASATAGGLALIAAAAIAVPRLVPDQTPDGFVERPGPTASPAPGPDDGLATLRHEREAYQIRFPTQWRVTRFEAAVELLPPEQIGLAAGEPTFAVEIQLLPGRYDDVDGFEGGSTLAGRPAVRKDEVAEGRVVTYRVDWTGARCEPEPDVACDPIVETLHLMVHASTQDLWDSYGEQGLAAAESLAWIHEAPLPTGAVSTPYGGTYPAVAFDQATIALLRFLDARVIGIDAEDHLGPEAADAFAGPDTGLGLYTERRTGDGWLFHTVRERRDAGDGTVAFEVQMAYDFIEDHGETSIDEELVVSPSGVVISARVIGSTGA